MASGKAIIQENVQKFVGKGDWKSAIAEMEKLFAVDQDPIVRVRIGDARQKLNQKAEAVKEYIRAADLYAEKGFVVKALAQYKLALRLDPACKDALSKIELLHSNKTVSELKLEPIEEGAPKPTRSVIPLFSDLTKDEFNEFTSRMTLHTVPAGKVIIREGETGRSVFILTRGAVKIYATISGKRVNLASLQTSDFFGEIAYLTGQPRTATVETSEESDMLEVSELNLNEMIDQKPRIKDVLKKYHEARVQSTIEKVREII